MPMFNFEGRDLTGKSISGKRVSQSPDTLGAQLTKEGIIPIKITSSDAVKTWNIDIGELFAPKSASMDELGMFSRQMYTLCKTGVPLASALRHMADSMKNKAMSKTIYGLVEHLEAGQDLASSMQNYPHIFTPLMISMVRVGQTSGQLAESFLRINQYIELEVGALKDIKKANRYPMFVLIALVAATVVINIFVIPAFANVFAQSKVELPAVTRFFIATSNFMRHHWITLLSGFILIAGSFLYYIKTPNGKLKWDEFLLSIPIMGKIIRRIVLLRFAQSFAITINSGVPLIQGIELIAESVNNSYARERILLMREAIERGNSLSQAAASTGLFNPLELQILSVSEETGELGPMLEQIAAFYRREVEYDLKRLSDFIEPVLILVLSAVVLVLAFAVYLPIWNMAKLAKIG